MNDAQTIAYYASENTKLRHEIGPLRTLFNVLAEHVDDENYDWRPAVRRAIRASACPVPTGSAETYDWSQLGADQEAERIARGELLSAWHDASQD